MTDSAYIEDLQRQARGLGVLTAHIRTRHAGLVADVRAHAVRMMSEPRADRGAYQAVLDALSQSDATREGGE